VTLEQGLTKLNLRKNPFENFELFDERAEDKTLREHEKLFKNRTEIIQKIEYAIMGSRSYKVALHGDLGIGKSSTLNKILYDLRKRNYFCVKYRVNETAASDPSHFERDLLKAFGEAVIRELQRNKGLRGLLESVVKSKTKRNAKQLALLAILYSSGQIKITEGKMDTSAISATVGLPFLKSDISDEETRYIEIARSEDLSHMVFEKLTRELIAAISEVEYVGSVIAIDEVDKIEDQKLETKILTLVKDTFYPSAISHILLVMATRNGRKEIHPDIFHYELIRPLSNDEVVEFLKELYKLDAIDQRIPMDHFVDKSVVETIYNKNQGKIRSILNDLFNCVVTGVTLSSSKIDQTVYNKALIGDPLYSYLKTLSKEEAEYKVLKYILDEGGTHSRDSKAIQTCNVSRSSLSVILKKLHELKILIPQKEKQRKITYSIDPSLRELVKRALA
jgi:GTPase SAR1 family protein